MIKELDRKITKLQADRQVWIKEAQSRAKLKGLELEAVVETRLKEMNAKINSITQDLQQIGDLSEFAQKIETSLTDLSNNITTLNDDMTTRLQDLENRIMTNERLIDRIDRNRGRLSTGRYYYPRSQGE